MDKSIKEMAEELGVSKTTISRKLKLLSPDLVTTNTAYATPVTMIKSEGQAILRALLQPKVKQNIKDVAACNSPVLEILQRELDTLQKELNIKNEQIMSLHKLLDQQQQLQAIAEKKQVLIEPKKQQEQTEQDRRVKEWNDMCKQAEREVKESQEYKEFCKTGNDLINQVRKELETERERVERLKNRGLIDRIINKEV